MFKSREWWWRLVYGEGLLPLCLLAKDGAQRKVAREIFEDVKTNKELLPLALSLASMVLTSEADQH